jgi:XTP/dITP diphosphohydrolase
MHPDCAPQAPLLSIVVASNNVGKIRELHSLFSDLPIEWVRVADVTACPWFVEETGATFEENALLKARAATAATGFVALADDSGLEVDALRGSPGVRSARFAHEHASDQENNTALIEALRDVEDDARTARFQCVLAVVTPGEAVPLLARGSCEGWIAREPSGSNGFGYDPLFRVRELGGASIATLSDEEKGKISHRGNAVRQLRPMLVQLLEKMIAQIPSSR